MERIDKYRNFSYILMLFKASSMDEKDVNRFTANTLPAYTAVTQVLNDHPKHHRNAHVTQFTLL